LFVDDAWTETHRPFGRPPNFRANRQFRSTFCCVCLRHSDKSQKPIILPWPFANFLKIFFPLFENVYYFLLYKTQLVYLRMHIHVLTYIHLNILKLKCTQYVHEFSKIRKRVTYAPGHLNTMANISISNLVISGRKSLQSCLPQNIYISADDCINLRDVTIIFISYKLLSNDATLRSKWRQVALKFIDRKCETCCSRRFRKIPEFHRLNIDEKQAAI